VLFIRFVGEIVKNKRGITPLHEKSYFSLWKSLKGGVIVCGGRGGIMRAVCKGAKEENGITVGILPESKEEANEFVDIPIVTGLGHRRNFLVIDAADAVIAIGGRWGTLNEISFSMVFEKPIILIKGTGGCVDEIANGQIMQDIESTYYVADSAEDAVEKAFEFFKSIG